MKKYDYKTEYIFQKDLTSIRLENRINSFSKMGYRLYKIVKVDDELYIIMEKEIEEEDKSDF